ncbi:unnamed protein product [Meloidogyne enterolobii]|uniref:Uncharacterized protein n=1 Tax=Meloidogyne enterolobii TaxID=390850 RepID=A0ACB1B0A6_MELEN
MEKPRKDPCIGSQIELAVFVNTRRELFHRRMGIRNSWAKDAVKNNLNYLLDKFIYYYVFELG